MNKTIKKTEKTDNNNDIVKTIRAECKKLGIDGRTLRPIKKRLKKIGTQAALTQTDASLLAGKLDNGNARARELAEALRKLLPDLPLGPTKKPEKAARKVRARTSARVHALVVDGRDAGRTALPTKPGGDLWTLVGEAQKDLPNLGLGAGIRTVKVALDNLTKSDDPMESIPSVTTQLEKGNAKAHEYAARLRTFSNSGTQVTPPGQKAVAPEPVRPEGAADTGDTADWSTGPIPLGKLGPSKWNRSFGAPPDEEYYRELADSINRDGLMHPLTLIHKSKTDDALVVLAGENRRHGLVKLRGKDGFLQPGEYRIREDLTEDDPRCLDVSLAENEHRRGMSPIETARFVVRLTEDLSLSQEKVGEKLGMPTPVVSQLSKLPKWWDRLPDSWKRDLAAAPGRNPSKDNSSYEPSITTGHWRQVVGKLKEREGVTKKLQRLMEKAASEHWSTKLLGERVKGKTAAPADETGTDDEQGSGRPPPGAAPPPSGPDFAGILTSLDNAVRLANKDEQVLAILQNATEGIVTLRDQAGEQKVA